MDFKLLFAIISLAFALAQAEFLSVQNRNLMYGSDRVFLSGVNIAWSCYGCDFGNNRYNDGSGAVLEDYVRKIALAGGNSLRIWIHIEGQFTPQFNGDGYVLGTDAGNTLISDLSRFLDYAAVYNVLVIPVLWNGALMREEKFKNLIWDDSKLTTYIDKALKPMVRALKNKPALGAWEIMNEPEGSITTVTHANQCYDTSKLSGSGAGWSGGNVPMERMLPFIAKQIVAIKQEDPKALVTVGSWSERPQTDAFSGTYNYYKDSCMIQAGGGSQLAKIDFYQIHTYSWEGKWSQFSPFKQKAAAYNLDKPLIVGEFASVCSEGESVEALFGYCYSNGYQGVWSWQFNAGGECSDSQEVQSRGMNTIRGYSHNGLVAIKIR